MPQGSAKTSRVAQRKLDLRSPGVDVSPVKTTTFGRIFSAFWVYVALLGCAASANSPVAPPVVPMGDNTFSITREASNGFKRDTDKLKAEVSEDAANYCAAQSKQLKVISLTSEKPWIGMGYVKAKIVFKAVNPGEVEQSQTSAPAVSEVREKLLSTDDLVSDLTKLDDLRKKGILTDEEFQAEKKKILNRTR
jgi:hypothetical protein